MFVSRLNLILIRIVTAVLVFATTAFAQNVEIHYINVGWGASVLLKGPDGTTVLMDSGNIGKGTSRVVLYLQSIRFQPATGLDYPIAGHQHCDHIGGMMWDPYIASTKAHLKNADSRIVFDKFHTAKHLSEAVARVRRQENKELRSQGDDRLVGTKYDWLRRPHQLRLRCVAEVQSMTQKYIEGGTSLGAEGNCDGAIHLSLYGNGPIVL
jgi:hypothetical protein